MAQHYQQQQQQQQQQMEQIHHNNLPDAPPLPDHQAYPYIPSHSSSWSSTPSTLVPPPGSEKYQLPQESPLKHGLNIERLESNDNDDNTLSLEKHPKKQRRMANRNCCARCCCCACCLPVWATWVVWIFIVAIIIVVIVIGSILATFKMPSIEFQGIAPIESDESIISFNNDKLSINFGLIVNIENRNIFPIYLYDVNAYGYYPYPEDPSTRTSIGDGHLDYELVPSQTNYNFTYPFTIKYDPASDPNLSILGSIADKCGLTGGAKGDLSIQYDIKLRARVLLFTIPLTISSSANFPCPLNFVQPWKW
ncbi:hypothetical protein PHYBLDRAFT_73128 [Phycomyces blakesleeanus NRRL 1555(-)]|uniref:Late embryogenesis abundant protein LEA-2 subgroup domain-containing protein n=1 Tax=Phycomyces blakesleeanus (strain ATCC 8743b / DSM 1359 / FGSC 10004 / NBRC 33097 / NRRL 1555) TaxID=763407 RepID=A0A167JJM5_PHYB8|nr:hypothetical protein PHYBLDRAFT_73128 [Phycomyces blakesleeanus NRRL 1555(-)]OAD66119.1 hypothetical protein PHYBLDRAFT_73128 [Phycomyces blakesleeanus NRRL 1555(-)]|eukprot:XP_018284159.1 hypothetical protein PHYBLDRAFT_73128 [Phycomyces blakesleeanus NRRL 1555(-)]